MKTLKQHIKEKHLEDFILRLKKLIGLNLERNSLNLEVRDSMQLGNYHIKSQR